MNTATSVLIAVAKELAAQAKSSMPELEDGETLQREWFSDGVYYRATEHDGKNTIYQFDFRQRKSRPAMAVE